MKIGLIGIGKIANYQMQAITHTDGVCLLDAHDLDLTRAEELPGSVQFYDDFNVMLQRSEADAFMVSTPTLYTLRNCHEDYRVESGGHC